MLQRVTFTIEPQTAEELAYLAERMGVSKSALVSSLLADPIHEMHELVKAIPDNPDELEVKRLRGKSIEVVEKRLDSLRKLDNDLFS